MNYNSRQCYKVLGRCKPEDVLPHTGSEAPNKTFFNYSVKMTSLRYQTFSKTTRCACCGIEGTVMLLELPTNGGKVYVPHFNLYAEREGKLVQMTKDHKQPKSKGGRDFIGNMQTMCCHCNELKGDQHLKGGNTKVLQKLRKIRDGSQAIYVVCDFAGYPVEGFATSQRGITEIIQRYIIDTRGWSEDYFNEKFEVRVDIEGMRVILEEEDGCQHSYYIRKIERI